MFLSYIKQLLLYRNTIIGIFVKKEKMQNERNQIMSGDKKGIKGLDSCKNFDLP